MRRRLREKFLREIRGIGSKEKRKINNTLRKISREVVNRAKENGAAIAIGDLKGVRKKNRSKTLNRIVNRYSKLIKFIEYKAMLDGVPAVKVKEYYTSKFAVDATV